jgi:uncharacterized membrane protein
MTVQASVKIDASVEHVWSQLIDVEGWPNSTASITSVQRLDDGPLRPGSRARIKQPKLPGMVWTVTDLQRLRSFTWEAVSPGVTTIGIHSITPNPSSGVTLTLAIQRRGLLAPMVDALTDGLTRKYVTMEANGMKRVCEAQPASAPEPSISRG